MMPQPNDGRTITTLINLQQLCALPVVEAAGVHRKRERMIFEYKERVL